MPHAEEFKHIQVTPLHPTFGAEVSGVDFSQRIPDEVFNELLSAATKVSQTPPCIGLVIFTASQFCWLMQLNLISLRHLAYLIFHLGIGTAISS